jgi:hypothetical protein
MTDVERVVRMWGCHLAWGNYTDVFPTL